jgi:hypothetical protein
MMPAGRGNVPKNNTLPGPNRGSSGSPGSPAGFVPFVDLF